MTNVRVLEESYVFLGAYTYRCPPCQITARGLSKAEARKTRTVHRRRVHGSPIVEPDGEVITRAPYIDQWRGPAIAVAVFVVIMLLAPHL
ncbi:hypothetical protein [Streptomyces sp. NPDC004546]|uniref:hypothetical protein n=1 Tax=Streptomyces sp. NPDC004546 TaxID=3154282 RepID=UPI0033A1E08F